MTAQAALANFIDDGGFARHIRKAGATYRARHELITRILAQDFAEYLEVIHSAAGLHVTALARGMSAKQVGAVVRRAADAGVAVQDLSRFTIDVPVKPGLVLGYGAISTDRIEEGLRHLRNCLRR